MSEEVYSEITEALNSITPEEWAKMNLEFSIKHCTMAMKMTSDGFQRRDIGEERRELLKLYRHKYLTPKGNN